MENRSGCFGPYWKIDDPGEYKDKHEYISSMECYAIWNEFVDKIGDPILKKY